MDEIISKVMQQLIEWVNQEGNAGNRVTKANGGFLVASIEQILNQAKDITYAKDAEIQNLKNKIAELEKKDAV